MKTTADIIKSIEKVEIFYKQNRTIQIQQPIQSPNLPTNTFLLDLTFRPYPPAP